MSKNGIVGKVFVLGKTRHMPAAKRPKPRAYAARRRFTNANRKRSGNAAYAKRHKLAAVRNEQWCARWSNNRKGRRGVREERTECLAAARVAGGGGAGKKWWEGEARG